jgi:pre-mRNA 3'-end-processing factor FIP1
LVNIKHQPATSTAVTAAAPTEVTQTAVSVLDLNAVGEYKGQNIFEVDMEGFDDRPWRKPGADITDYFNYGFDENSWRIYSQRQKQLRDDKSLHTESFLPLNPMGLPSGPAANDPIAAAAAAAAMRSIMAMRGGFAGGGRGRGAPSFPFPMDQAMWNTMQQQHPSSGKSLFSVDTLIDRDRDRESSKRQESRSQRDDDYRSSRRYRSKSPDDHYHRRGRH